MLLIRVLLWLAAGYIIYWLFLKFIPKSLFAAFGGAVLLSLMILAFYDPAQKIPEPVWQFFIFPFKPLSLALCLLLAALISIFRKSEEKLLKIWLSFAFALLLLFSTPIVSQQIVKFYENGSAVAAKEDLNKQVRAIILLGQNTTRINLPGGGDIQLTDRGDRLLYTAQLYREQARNNPSVIVSAGVRENLSGEEKLRLETQSIETFLERQGVPEAAIIQDPRSPNIHTSAVNSLKILQERELQPQEVMLVTSAINMGRSYLTFKKLEMNVIPRPTNFYGIAGDNEDLKPKFQPTDLIPSINALTVTTKVFEDLFGTIYYFLRGWISLDFGFYTG
ncbi:YdcF family protein [[Leptolyngbya] sp. PCC 7376]|uniref:YdcF family protein n=1 Tax=[Leptolyngbya] sp. PCC 7376 TaxID=111781 RepID=UPI001C1E53A3|nr:YdcF family protein [[Leptolyngbya] sp. PCC 7376]